MLVLPVSEDGMISGLGAATLTARLFPLEADLIVATNGNGEFAFVVVRNAV